MTKMDITAFKKIHNHFQKEKPKIFLLSEPDPPASEEQLIMLEKEIGCILPPSYRDFLKNFGGGFFGFTNIFSANPNSDLYLPNKINEYINSIPSDFIPFSDDFSGGTYILNKINTQNEQIFYWNYDGGIQETNFNNVFEFVAKYAYTAA